MVGKRHNHNCIPHWMIDEYVFGRCLKYRKKKHLCRDTGLPCPFNGERDFAKLQERNRKRLYALESNRKGGTKPKERER
jgi:hypothetical protein